MWQSAPRAAPEQRAELKDTVKVCGQSGLLPSNSGASGSRPVPAGRLNLRQTLAMRNSPERYPHDASMVSGLRRASRASNLFSALT